MSSRVRPINLVNFTGGLNLRADAFELGEGESPDMLNVDVDPRGGFVARKGWTRWNTSDVAVTWDPRTMYVHELSSGTDRVFLANNGLILRSDDGVTWTVLNSTTDIVAAASPHLADFAPWGDTVYIACGKTVQSVKVVSAGTVTRMTQAEAGTFTEYDAPSSGRMPHADYIAAHQGYIFVASTEEGGTNYPHRVRWSHPNNPEAWQEDDYIDVQEGGGVITGLVPMRDHLLIFKQSAVYALFGYDSDSWQVVNVSREKGAPHRQAIARTESAVFFYSHLEGVFALGGGEFPKEVSESLRPIFKSGDFATAATENVWLGWLGQRLWFSVPYSTETSASDATTCFVFDPTIGEGAWMAYRGSDGFGLGPFAQGGFGGGSGLLLGASRSTPSVMQVEANDTAQDDFDGTPAGFESYYVTKWMDGGFPTLKKSWRRPDLVTKERDADYTVTIQVYRDYDESDVVRTKTITVAGGAVGGVWGAFTWGSDVWGSPAKGSMIERAGSLGPARAVQLRLTGQVSKPWGVDAIIFKFIPRRMR
jgi:hypothetical protein